MIPGSVQAVRNKNICVEMRQRKNTRGRAGVTFQLSATTKMQKGMTMARMQNCI
jgi:hypothetical protein